MSNSCQEKNADFVLPVSDNLLIDAYLPGAYAWGMTAYSQTTAYLMGLIDYEKTPAQIAVSRYLNLDRMREALARAGNPHTQFRAAHLAGTKGKGSTAAMTAAILRAAGHRVGLYTSPHLVAFSERIRVDGEPISESALAELVAEVEPVVDAMRATPLGPPTFFEVATLLAFLWFARCRVDVAVLETGMGGRLDATNVVTPLVTAITTIAIDHTAELGETLELIAGEKAGIIKPGVPVVSAPQDPEAAAVIARIATERGSPLYRVGEELRLWPSTFYTPRRERFSVQSEHGVYADLACPLLGEHQQTNAAVAIGIIERLQEAGVPVQPAEIRTGLATVHWPGRLQVVRERPLLILDGAHDPASIAVLLAALARHFPGHPRRFIAGFSREKDWPAMLRQLAPAAEELLLTAANSPRAVPPDQLADEARPLLANVTTAPDIGTALQELLRRAAPEELLCVTGSLYLVGDALRALDGY